MLGGWGQTEDALVTLGIPGDPEEKIVERDGYPWPGMRIRVVDDAGQPLPPGQEGALQVTGPFLFVGYWERPELTRAGFDGEWFGTGDLATIDEDGYLSITGRTKDMIIRGGENIPVAYVENVLYEHPDLADVAVVGVPDPRLQERACAVVTLRPGFDGCASSWTGVQALAARVFGVPRRPRAWPASTGRNGVGVVPELPRTPSGTARDPQRSCRGSAMLARAADGDRRLCALHAGRSACDATCVDRSAST